MVQIARVIDRLDKFAEELTTQYKNIILLGFNFIYTYTHIYVLYLCMCLYIYEYTFYVSSLFYYYFPFLPPRIYSDRNMYSIPLLLILYIYIDPSNIYTSTYYYTRTYINIRINFSKAIFPSSFQSTGHRFFFSSNTIILNNTNKIQVHVVYTYTYNIIYTYTLFKTL